MFKEKGAEAVIIMVIEEDFIVARAIADDRFSSFVIEE